MIFNKIPYLLALMFIVSSCTQRTYDDIESDEDSGLETVTYLEVKPIIDNACLNCHSNPTQNGAPMSLTTYDNVKEAVLNRDLLNKISLNDGADGLMPLGGPRLAQALIDVIIQWEEEGLLEN